ncbi:MAG: formate dehydrogenase accessory sulfurtransferase FdhD [Bacteroidota bacterium]
MKKASVAPVQLKRFVQDQAELTPDLLAVEEPLEIRIGFGPASDREQRSISVTMRTPGHDFELSLGFLFTEGIIQSADQVREITHCRDVGRQEEVGNVVRVELQPEVEIDFKKLERHFYTTSSCGVCGKTSIEAVHQSHCRLLPPSAPMISSDVLHQLPETLRATQAVFEHTGGLHAAALFSSDGDLIMMREDVGRHNAMDKLIGAALESGLVPLHTYVVLVSGRASFELVQKAIAGGIPLMAAVGAPSSLAVNLANESNMSLVGFLRNNRFNLYCGFERVHEPISLLI